MKLCSGFVVFLLFLSLSSFSIAKDFFEVIVKDRSSYDFVFKDYCEISYDQAWLVISIEGGGKVKQEIFVRASPDALNEIWFDETNIMVDLRMDFKNTDDNKSIIERVFDTFKNYLWDKLCDRFFKPDNSTSSDLVLYQQSPSDVIGIRGHTTPSGMT